MSSEVLFMTSGVMPSHSRPTLIAAWYSILSASGFVSSIRKMNFPPYILAYSELMIAAFAWPMWGYPLGSGGNLVTTWPCTAPCSSGRPFLSSLCFGARISGKLSAISSFCSWGLMELTWETIPSIMAEISGTLPRRSGLAPRTLPITAPLRVCPPCSDAF